MRELLLVNLEGLRYGIWEDEVLSVDELRSIHRLPMSPAYLAGVSIIHDRTVTLADLSACVGHAPMQRGAVGHVLLMSDTEKFAGFVLEGNIDKASIGPDFVHPVPDYLKTPVIDSCVILNSLPIPVLNLPALYHQIQKPDYEQPSTPLVPVDDRQDLTGIETIKIIEINNERFCVSAERMEEQAVEPGHITKLAQARPFVSGVALHQGRILTVIDLYQRLFMRKSDNASRMLVAEIRNALFGFLIHADKGTLQKEEFFIKDLPPIAQSDLLHAFVKHAGEILPLLDLGKVVSFGQKDRPEKPLWLRYAPDSSFLDLYRKETVEVVEFSLLGALHALPKSEVKDIISCKPYRVIPNAPDIVIGVAEHNDEVLPVLDLAMVFGRRSLSTPEWRMIQVVNGDFQALVLTETVFGERLLTQEVQRAVPILLPHHVVYGCYPDADTVRLILNVTALAMYFEKALVQELLPALSAEMKQARAELVPSLLEETEILSAVAVESEAPKEQHIPQEPVAVLQPAKAEEVIPVLEQPAVHEIIETTPLSTEKEKARMEVEERVRQEAEEQARREAEEKALQEVEEQQKVEVAARAAEEERVRREAEEKIREAEAKTSQETEERARREAEEQAKREAEEKALREVEERQKAEAAARVAEEERIRKETEEKSLQEAAERARREELEQTRREAEQQTLREAEEQQKAKKQAAAEALRKDQAERKAREEAAAVVQEAEEIARREKENAIAGTTAPSTSFESEEAGVAHVKTLAKPPMQWESFVTVAIIGIVIVAVLYLLFRKPMVEVKEAKTPVETVQKGKKGPLVLTVPNGVSVGADEYSVKKGDTLWGISKRFTGDPFNYPSIAGENNIVDPDLIYPEQRVIIKKKEQ